MTRLDTQDAKYILEQGYMTVYITDDGRTLTPSKYYITRATYAMIDLAQSITLYAPTEVLEVRDLMLEHIKTNPFTPYWEHICTQIEAVESLTYNEANIVALRLGGTTTYILAR